MRFKKAKCKVLHSGCYSPSYVYRLGEKLIESNSAEKGLGVVMNEKLDISQQSAL